MKIITLLFFIATTLSYWHGAWATDYYTYTHVKYWEESDKKLPSGDTLCYFELHNDPASERFKRKVFQDYFPCELVRAVLNGYQYETRPRDTIEYYGNLVKLSSSELKIEKGNVFESLFLEYRKFGHTKEILPIIETFIPMISNSLKNLSVPVIDEPFAYAAAISFFPTEPSFEGFLTKLRQELGSEYILKEVSHESFNPLPKKPARYFQLSKENQHIKFYITNGIKPFGPEIVRPEFSHVEAWEKPIIAPDGTSYCFISLRSMTLRITEYMQYMPCELIHTVLNAYHYKSRPVEGRWKDIYKLGSDELQIEGDFFTAMLNEYKKLGNAEFKTPLDSYIPIVASALSEFKIPQLPDGYEEFTFEVFNDAFEDSNPLSPGSFPSFMQRVVVELNKNSQGERYILTETDELEKFKIRPRCFAYYYRLKRGLDELYFWACAASQPFGG